VSERIDTDMWCKDCRNWLTLCP